MGRCLFWKCLGCLIVLHGLFLASSTASAQTPCGNAGGPDVIVGDLTDPGSDYASVGGIEAFDIGTTSCNVGDAKLKWIASTNEHPVIGQNLYRYKTVNGSTRFEQVGQSWLKHGFTALAQTLCCACQVPSEGGTRLGIGCSDPYCCGLNGGQTGLGPKFEVNPHTGVFPYPFTGINTTGNSIFKRLQVHITDLDPAQNSGALYYGEAQYVTADDAAANHQNNNVSHRLVTLTGAGSSFNISMTSTTQREKPAIRAWKIADPTVTETDVQIPSDGLLVVSSKATNFSGTQWHYEYAVYNMNADRAIGTFTVPLPAGVSVCNIGFHDVDYHSGDGIGNVNYDGTDWPATVSGGNITWSTTPYATNQNANALRWGTMYNFRFDVNASPAAGSATLGLFKPGTPASVTAAIVVPSTVTSAPDCNGNGVSDSLDIANGTSQDCNSNCIPDECENFPAVQIASQLVAGGFSSPVYVCQPTGDSSRLFVVEQAGYIKIRDLVGNTTLATPFLDISAIITLGGERGLLGLAFHPQYQSNGFFYIYYTDASGNSTVARYTASANPNVADAASQVILKTIAQTSGETNHKAGCLQFGKDGMLYVGLGDGGGAYDQHGTFGNGQNTGVLLGKILRLDVANPAGGYIPANNPFVGPGNPLDEIWSYGMRNPWRFSFDRLTGDLYIGDVGQDTSEEIDFEPYGSLGGRNYGWRCTEGTTCTNQTGCTCNGAGLTPPIFEYLHSSFSNPGQGIALTGGYVYRGCVMPGLHGRYFYGDYGQNIIRSFKYTTTGGITDTQDNTASLGNIVAPVSFGQDNAGELYVVSYLGNIYKIVPFNGPVCGNGILEAGEECDDGNNIPGDGCFNCHIEPGNNDFCVAATLICTGSFTGSTVGKTNDGQATCGTSNASPDVWYKYIPTTSGTLNVNTCGSNDLGGADLGMDNVLSIYSGCPGTTANQLACNDDWGTGGLPANACSTTDLGTNHYDSAVSIAVTAGHTYFIRVSGYNGSNGPFNLNVSGPGCGIVHDCNGNGVDDSVDLVNGTSLDCNANGIPDSCDIAAGTSLDCAHNGIPDECEFPPYDAIPATPISIPDNTPAGITHVFNVPDHGIIQDLNLGLKITHTWNGDLIVKLTHGAVTRTLIDRPGYTGTGFGFDNDGFDGFTPAAPLLDDEGTGGPIEMRSVAAGVTSPPSYTPNQTLSGFDGQDRFGPWTLFVSDNASSDTGSLVRWMLQFTIVAQPCPPDCNNNGIPDATDIANHTSNDCDNNGVPDECQIAANPALDCDGGPVGIASGGAAIFASTCGACHNTSGQGGPGCGGTCPGPNIRNKSRKFIWNELLPPTSHPGGAHPEFTQQDFANLEAYLADGGSRGRPDNILDSCQQLADCNNNGVSNGCELEAGTQVDLNYDGIPDSCQQCPGPVNGDGNADGLVNGRDIPGFVAAVIAHSTNLAARCAYDFDANQSIGLGDLPGMINALLAP